jgi:hypothetical protein
VVSVGVADHLPSVFIERDALRFHALLSEGGEHVELARA